MAYYSGVIEHDTGLHADAEQTATGTQMLMVNITLAEYRSLIEDNARSSGKIKDLDDKLLDSKQKYFDALECIGTGNMTETQKKDYTALMQDYRIKKGGAAR